MIDTHAHLDMDEFDNDREDVIARAREHGVRIIITIGIDPASCRKAIQLAETHPGIYAGLGLHPHEAGKYGRSDIDELERMAAHPRVVGIGETGLDLFRNYSPEDEQRKLFRWQLELSRKLDKPIIIHSRQAEHETVPILAEWVASLPQDRETPGVIHCYSGDEETTKRYLDMGFYLAFGAYIGYPKSRSMYPVIAGIPSDRIVVETDCPFLPPQDRRGKRNEPAYVPQTVNTLVSIRGVTWQQVAQETTANARRLFRLPPEEA